MFLPIRLKASHWSLVTLNFKINCSGKEQIKNNGSFRIHSVNSEIRIIRHVPGFPPQFVLTFYPFAFICVCVCVCACVCMWVWVWVCKITYYCCCWIPLAPLFHLTSHLPVFLACLPVGNNVKVKHAYLQSILDIFSYINIYTQMYLRTTHSIILKFYL